ncbi:MAK10-like protein [Tanacetum coccineum]
MSRFMASQDAKMSLLECEMKQQLSEMTNKFDMMLKAMNDRSGALPTDTIKNPKVSVNATSSMLSYPSCEDPQGSSTTTDSVKSVKSCIKSPTSFWKGMPQVKSMAVEINEQPKTQEPEETQKDDIHLNHSGLEAPTLNDKLKLGEKGLGDSKPFDTLADLWSNMNLIPLCLYRTLNIGLLEGTNSTLVLADGSKAYPIGLVRNVEVQIGALKLLDDFYVVDMKQDPTCPLLVGRGLLAKARTVTDCSEPKITIGEGSTKSTYAAIKQECSDEEESDWTTIVRRPFYTPHTNDNVIGPKKPCYLED